ncbi:hypothetical protein LIER_09570 [Lithospermum erythrorhizon]|uniref:Uncharacterized protein n=1 Tax=Lithospermum erythrorhizon TaxID=34254 RepID=A0AAV3PHT6_LITER
MVRYHVKGKGKVYSPSDAHSALHSCQVTWRATRLDRDGTFYFDDGVSHSVFDRAFFINVHTGRVCHMVGSEFVVEPYNPYRISRQERQTVTFPGDTTLNSPPVSYKSWLNKFFSSEVSPRLPAKRGKGKSLPAGVHPSTLVFRSSVPSKRKRSSDSNVEDRVPKHARGTRKETSSSRGSRVVSLVCSSN